MPGQFLYLQRLPDSSLSYTAEAPLPVNLVTKGGGKKGHGYPGAIEVLEQKGVKIRRVAGTSAGALTALALALGGSAEDCNNAAMTLDQNLLGGPGNVILKEQRERAGEWALEKIMEIVARRIDLARLGLKESKEESPEELARFFQQIHLTDYGNITFGQLHQLAEKYPDAGFKDLFITGTNVTDQKLDIFSYKTTPDMPIALAARISMSIPMLFPAVTYKDKVYVDGGCLNNFPVEIFDSDEYRENPEEWPYTQALCKNSEGEKPNLCTLGLFIRGETQDPFAHVSPDWTTSLDYSFRDYVSGVGYGESQEKMLKSLRLCPERVITISDTGLGMKEFDAPQYKIDNIYKAGKSSAENWVAEFENRKIPVAAAGDLQELLTGLDDADLHIMSRKITAGELIILDNPDLSLPDLQRSVETELARRAAMPARLYDRELKSNISSVKFELNDYLHSCDENQKYLVKFIIDYLEISPPRNTADLVRMLRQVPESASGVMMNDKFRNLLDNIINKQIGHDPHNPEIANVAPDAHFNNPFTKIIPAAEISEHLGRWRLRAASGAIGAGDTVHSQNITEAIVTHHIVHSKQNSAGIFAPPSLHIAAVTQTITSGGKTSFLTDFYSSDPRVNLDYPSRYKIIAEECQKMIELARQQGIEPSRDRPFKVHQMSADLKKAAVLFFEATGLPYVFDGTPPIRVKPERVAEMRKFLAEQYPQTLTNFPKSHLAL